MEPFRARRNLPHPLPLKRSGTGFTLIELLVVLAIILVITAVTITNQASFDKSVVLSNTAYDIALAIRSAETFGLGSRGVVAGSQFTNVGYGIHFDRSTPKSFILFADTYKVSYASYCHPAVGPEQSPGDCVYTAGSDAPPVNTYTLGNGAEIGNICVHYYVKTIWGWSFSWWFCSLGNADIVFARPNAEVSFSENWWHSQYFDAACIDVTSSDKSSNRYIVVSASGEIQVTATPPTPNCEPLP